MPGTRDRLQEISGRDGSVDFGRDRRMADISARIFVRGASFAHKRQLFRNIAAWLNSPELKPLIFSDEPDKQYWARQFNDINPDESAFKGWMDLGWIAPSGNCESISTKQTGASGVNLGTDVTPCIITCTVAQQTESLRVNLVQSGEFVLLQRHNIHWPVTLQPGDVVTIDTSRELTLVNGVDARPGVAALSDYFKLPPGSFSISSEPSVSMQVEYRERWL